ncbi:hypothetical protein QOZ80_6BG0474280 [Eleusine coracana subsp. coracana]|nr:hypothetical protein QOZ80_6BG0474280 [Eleusine coracana subsp. coracana]
MYAAAEIDGVGVCLTSQRGTHNTVWAVEHAQGPDRASVLLRGAYGRYLSSANGVVATQADLEQDRRPRGLLWHVMRRRGAFLIGCGLGRYLRANGRYLWWRRGVTVAEDNHSTMLLWTVERVRPRLTRPSILDPTYQLTHRFRGTVTQGAVTRLIRFIRCEPNGDFHEAAWWAADVATNNLMQLWLTMARSMGLGPDDLARTTICIRAGRFGQFSPLQIDLPLGNNRIDIVLVNHATPAGNNLRYPDLDAPEDALQSEDIN